MGHSEEQRPCDRQLAGGGRFAVWVLVLLSVYAAGLTHGLSSPWTGMHDWNGAFFSQLGRNLLRYPLNVHHGMGVVAVGDAVPPPEERSIYAAHPPGLVWMVAGSFSVLGESERSARLVAIGSSLGALILLVWLVRVGWGGEAAVLAGLLYSVLPMSVYFGRMVDHEAVCLLCMLGAIAAWQVVARTNCAPRRRTLAWGCWSVAIVAGIWLDWSAVLFSGLFCLHAIWRASRQRKGCREVAYVLIVSAVGLAGMLIYLVYSGLDGRWGDLAAIFFSRAGEVEGAIRRDLSAQGGAWDYTRENLTWPVLVLALWGVFTRFLHTKRKETAGIRLDGAWLLPVTGLLWLALFWRQYERHNYWMFYLGPMAAVLASLGLLALRESLSRVGIVFARGAWYVIAGVVVAVCLVQTDDYFARQSYPLEEVAALREINATTDPTERVLLYEESVLVEQRGGYRFRNIVPPQRAYYLDRAFGVEREVGAVINRASDYAMFVIPVADALRLGSALDELHAGHPPVQAGRLLVFDLRSGRGGEGG
ncbi:MAG: glycosyltransferase family 39 protein [Planctomycetota bacterium]